VGVRVSEKTSIEWTDFTFNPWWGCSKVSAGCANCYAEKMGARFGVKWGKAGDRRFASQKYWRQPERWNAAAKKAGKSARVFCASMADVFEDGIDYAWRRSLWATMRDTPWLDWQVLTKRPENFSKYLPEDWPAMHPNVWLGVSVENQEAADKRIPILLRTPAAVHFVSAEPLLDPVDLSAWMPLPVDEEQEILESGAEIAHPPAYLDWVIVGGESGHGARPFNIQWARSLVAQCRDAGVAAFVKQLGAKPYWENPHARSEFDLGGGMLELHDRKGGDPTEWPEGLDVRQFPEPR
jgi:protein gp37